MPKKPPTNETQTPFPLQVMLHVPPEEAAAAAAAAHMSATNESSAEHLTNTVISRHNELMDSIINPHDGGDEDEDEVSAKSTRRRPRQQLTGVLASSPSLSLTVDVATKKRIWLTRRS